MEDNSRLTEEFKKQILERRSTILTDRAIDLIREERRRQRDQWGDQENVSPYEWVSILGEEFGELCEAINETYFQNPKHPERGGEGQIVREAVQLAAVAVEIIEVFTEDPEGKHQKLVTVDGVIDNTLAIISRLYKTDSPERNAVLDEVHEAVVQRFLRSPEDQKEE